MGVHRIEHTSAVGAPEKSAIARRRQSRREEFREQERLAALLERYLPHDVFFSGLENRPGTRLAGLYQRKRGVKPGLTDLIVLFRGKLICLELKSRRGSVSKIQRVRRAELMAAGASWSVIRTARAGLVALHREGVPFRRRWTPPKLRPWEGPVCDPRDLPVPPEVVRERRLAKRRWRARQGATGAAMSAASVGAEVAGKADARRIDVRVAAGAVASQAPGADVISLEHRRR